MNREFLPETVLGITIGLLLAVIAVYRTDKVPSGGVMARGGMIALVVYAIIAAQVLVTDGLTIVGMVLLLVMVGVAVAGMMLAERTAAIAGPTARAARAIVSIGLAAAMLIAAGQTLAMMGLVDPRTVVLVIAVVAGLLVALEGLRASGRLSSLAVWLLIIPIVLVLVLGVLLGNVGQAVSPIIETGGVPIGTVASLLLAFVVLGAADSGLAVSHRVGGWSPLRVLGGAFVVVILMVFGMLMFFGGAIVAPTVQFFVIPANINAVPGPVLVIMTVLTLLFAAAVATALSGLRPGESTDPQASGESSVDQALPSPGPTVDVRVFAGAVALAVVMALVDPGMDWVVIATSLVAAAVAAATSERGLQVGLAGAVVLIVGLTITGAMTWGWWAALAVAGVAAIGRGVSMAGGAKPEMPAKESEALTG